MERLTMRNSDGSVSQPMGTTVEDVFYRLADYEDTGLTPEEIVGLCSMSERAKMADLLRLEEYQDIGTINHLRELAQSEKDGRQPATTRGKTCDANTAEAEYLLGVLWNGLHNNDGMDSKVADRVAEIAHEGDKVQPATTPKNDPLTMEELRVMDGEPIWVEKDGRLLGCALVYSPCSIAYLTISEGTKWDIEDLLDEGCKIYRRRPEGHDRGL